MKKALLILLMISVLITGLYALSKERMNIEVGASFLGNTMESMDKGNLGPYVGISNIGYVGDFFKFGFGTNFDIYSVLFEGKADVVSVGADIDLRLDFAIDIGSFMSVVIAAGAGFGDNMIFNTNPYRFNNQFGIDILALLDVQFAFTESFGMSIGVLFHTLMPLFDTFGESSLAVDRWPGNFSYSLVPKIGFSIFK